MKRCTLSSVMCWGGGRHTVWQAMAGEGAQGGGAAACAFPAEGHQGRLNGPPLRGQTADYSAQLGRHAGGGTIVSYIVNLHLSYRQAHPISWTYNGHAGPAPQLAKATSQPSRATCGTGCTTQWALLDPASQCCAAAHPANTQSCALVEVLPLADPLGLRCYTTSKRCTAMDVGLLMVAKLSCWEAAPWLRPLCHHVTLHGPLGLSAMARCRTDHAPARGCSCTSNKQTELCCRQ